MEKHKTERKKDFENTTDYIANAASLSTTVETSNKILRARMGASPAKPLIPKCTARKSFTAKKSINQMESEANKRLHFTARDEQSRENISSKDRDQNEVIKKDVALTFNYEKIAHLFTKKAISINTKVHINNRSTIPMGTGTMDSSSGLNLPCEPLAKKTTPKAKKSAHAVSFKGITGKIFKTEVNTVNLSPIANVTLDTTNNELKRIVKKVTTGSDGKLFSKARKTFSSVKQLSKSHLKKNLCKRKRKHKTGYQLPPELAKSRKPKSTKEWENDTVTTEAGVRQTNPMSHTSCRLDDEQKNQDTTSECGHIGSKSNNLPSNLSKSSNSIIAGLLTLPPSTPVIKTAVQASSSIPENLHTCMISPVKAQSKSHTLMDNWGMLIERSKTVAEMLMESRSKRLARQDEEDNFSELDSGQSLQPSSVEEFKDFDIETSSGISRQSSRLKRKYDQDITHVNRKRLGNTEEPITQSYSEFKHHIQKAMVFLKPLGNTSQYMSNQEASTPKLADSSVHVENGKECNKKIDTAIEESDDSLQDDVQLENEKFNDIGPICKNVLLSSNSSIVPATNNKPHTLCESHEPQLGDLAEAENSAKTELETAKPFSNPDGKCSAPASTKLDSEEATEEGCPFTQDLKSTEVIQGEAVGKPFFDETNSIHSLETSSILQYETLLNKFKFTNPKVISNQKHTNLNKSFWLLDDKNKAVHPERLWVDTPAGMAYPIAPSPPPDISSSEVVNSLEKNNNFIPLCACKIVGTSFANISEKMFCNAFDSIDGKIIGCCNKISNPSLLRPSIKVPFMSLCEMHRLRLKKHQCCPVCGHFCSQGTFYTCTKDRDTVHIFHQQCQMFNKYLCPHCGEESGQHKIQLELNLPIADRAQNSINIMAQKPLPRARISHSTQKEKIEDEQFFLPSSDGLHMRDLEKILQNLQQDRLEELLSSKKTLPRTLYKPAKKGEIEKVITMLLNGIKPNKRHEDVNGQTALHAAAEFGNLVIAQCLVQAGAVVNLCDKHLKTPLMLAAENNHVNIIHYLVKAGSNLESKDKDGMTCLQLAAKSGQLEAVKYFLEKCRVDVNIKDDGGWTALVWAAEHRHLAAVEYLLSAGADCNMRDNEENIGLHWAAFSGSVDIAEMFLNAGSDLESINEHGDRPLHVATRQDHYDCVVLFLSRGADCTGQNIGNETPLMVCADQSNKIGLALRINQQLRGFATKVGPQEILLHRDISCGRENNPIPCINEFAKLAYPHDYQYVCENVETMLLNINRLINGLQCCGCNDDCSSVHCVCGRNSVKCWFDKNGRLLEDFNQVEPPLIFECNKACKCWTTCNNRVIQNGIRTRLEVFRTQGRGWGCRTLLDISQGTFVCEYVGEIISDAEADRRQDDSYLFDLDNRDGETYCLDARRYGNVARFINHLCEPNLIPVKVFVEHQDLRFPRICFFASRDIFAGEELGFDYGEKFWIIKWKQFTCACNSVNCKYSSEKIQQTIQEYNRKQLEDAILS